MSHVVTGPLAVIADSTGKLRYYYAGAQLPADLPAHRVERLVNRGLVTKVAEPDELTLEALGLIGLPGDSGTPLTPMERPKTVATKELWVDYRYSQGLMTAEQVGLVKSDDLKVTKEQLQDDEFMASFKQPPATPPVV